MDFANLLMSICKLDYITVVQNKAGEIVGYGLMAPSISRGVRLGKGRLFPWVFWGSCWISEDQRCWICITLGSCLPTRTGSERHYHIQQHCQCHENGVAYAETGPELEDNVKVQSQWKL